MTKNVDEEKIRRDVTEHAVVMYSKPACGYCKMAKELFLQEGMRYAEKDLDLIRALNPDGFQEYINGLVYVTRQTTVPQIFICGKFIGGYTELNKIQKAGQLWKRVEECADLYDRKVITHYDQLKEDIK